jgi:hypothetical protein
MAAMSIRSQVAGSVTRGTSNRFKEKVSGKVRIFGYPPACFFAGKLACAFRADRESCRAFGVSLVGS